MVCSNKPTSALLEHSTSMCAARQPATARRLPQDKQCLIDSFQQRLIPVSNFDTHAKIMSASLESSQLRCFLIQDVLACCLWSRDIIQLL